jgi:hypothetical protein
MANLRALPGVRGGQQLALLEHARYQVSVLDKVQNDSRLALDLGLGNNVVVDDVFQHETDTTTRNILHIGNRNRRCIHARRGGEGSGVTRLHVRCVPRSSGDAGKCYRDLNLGQCMLRFRRTNVWVVSSVDKRYLREL